MKEKRRNKKKEKMNLVHVTVQEPAFKDGRIFFFSFFFLFFHHLSKIIEEKSEKEKKEKKEKGKRREWKEGKVTSLHFVSSSNFIP